MRETPTAMTNASPTALLLNVAHALDHLFLLIFATAVSAIAAEWGMIWQDLMPYTVGAFVLFGLGSLPAGRLGDLWGRRAMMVVFFLGMGLSGLAIATVPGVGSLAVALTVMGAFSSIYHPVGIPMLVQSVKNPGFTIGLNGLAGNLGIAVAAVLTGFLVKYAGWRVAFAVPGLIALVCGVLFVLAVPREDVAPAKRPQKMVDLPRSVLARVLTVMTLAAISGSLIFNFTTNGNGQLLAERLHGVVDDPATIGALLAVVYTVASFAQLIVGKLIDRVPLKWVYVPVAAGQIPLFLFASQVTGWPHYIAMPDALARGRHPLGRRLRRQLARRLPARPDGEGGRLHHAPDRPGRPRGLHHVLRVTASDLRAETNGRPGSNPRTSNLRRAGSPELRGQFREQSLGDDQARVLRSPSSSDFLFDLVPYRRLRSGVDGEGVRPASLIGGGRDHRGVARRKGGARRRHAPRDQ